MIVQLIFELSGIGLLFYSPGGKSLVFLSAKSAVDSGAHSATNSLHRIDWPADGKLQSSLNIFDVVRSFLFYLKVQASCYMT